VGARLHKLLEGTGVHLLHDRRMGGHGKANIDHVTVGPGGVTVIDAKALGGDVRVEAVGGLFSQREQLLKVAGRDRTRLVRGVRAQGEVVRACLAAHGFPAVEVRCALCFAAAGGLPLLRRLELDGVTIDGTRRVAKLARRPGSLREAEVQRVLQALATALPAA
jgi:nuclease-like protein